MMKKPFDLSEALKVETFETTFASDTEVLATTYVTAADGITCFHGDTRCGIQVCNPHTEVCF